LKAGRAWSRWLAASFAVVCVVLPLTVVTYPPITDLPQHLVQIRLLQETLNDPQGPYRIQWLAPYGLAYLPLAVGWLLADPVVAGRIGVGLLLTGWVGAVHVFAGVRGRSVASALLASTLASGFSLYWGFLPFLAGFPLFLWWLHRCERSEQERGVTPRELAVLTALATFLYLAHAHWYAMASLWLGLSGLRARLPLRYQLLRGLSLLPAALLGLLWLRVVRAMGLDSAARWVSGPWERWSPRELISSIVGGPRGLGRELLLVVLILWIGVGVLAWWRHRSRLAGAAPPGDQEARPDSRLLWAGGLMLAVATFTPEYYLSLWSAKRWWAPAVTLIVLGVPAPARRLRWTAAGALVLASWTALAVTTWRRFERVELRGLDESLAALPEGARLVGLDYVRSSRIFDGRPFLHGFAYGQALKGGSSNFSFARFPASPVVVREVRESPWTDGLEWYPDRLRRSDLDHFDFVLVNAPAARLEEFPRRAPVEPVTQTDPWRLYRVVRSER
jgi:hypothetical protein